MVSASAHRVGLWVGFFALTVVRWVAAQPAPASAAERTHDNTRECTSANALSNLACELKRQLPPELNDVLVVAARLPSSESDQLDALSQELTKVVAGKFHKSDVGPAGSLASARALSTHRRFLVYLMPELQRAHLRVTLDVYPVPNGFWDRFKPPPGSSHHAYAEQRVDPEIQSYFPIPPLVAHHTTRAASPSSHVNALACGDVDGDRALELVVVSRQSIHIGVVRQEKLITSQHKSWHSLAPVAPVPLREPIATAAIARDAGLIVGSTDRSHLVRLDPELKPLFTTDGKIPWGTIGCAQRAGLGLAATVKSCEGDQSWENFSIPSFVDAVLGETLPTRTGSVRIAAARDAEHAELQLQDTDGRLARIEDVGAALALGDLNRDGYPEVLVSRNTLRREVDGVRVYSWQAEGLVLAYELEVASGVDALATCPAEDEGLGAFVIATQGELWIVQ